MTTLIRKISVSFSALNFNKKFKGGNKMILHYNQDGTISMKLNIRGKVISRIFLTYQDYKEFVSQLN